MSALQFQSLGGMLGLCLLAWAMGGFKRGVSWRVLAIGLASVLGLAALLLNVAWLRVGFGWLGQVVEALARATRAGTSLVFGYLGGAPLPFTEPFPGAGFILFFQALPLVLLVGALSAVLFHWGVLGFLIRLMARVLRRVFGLGGASGFGVAANVFVGMVEAPLMIRPWLARMNTTELFVVMTAGMATIAGNMFVIYALVIAPVVPDAAGQLLTASLISAPAAVLVALLMMPGDTTTTADEAPVLRYSSTMEALVQGIGDGLQLMLGVMAALIVFVALVALVNEALQPLLGLKLEQIAGVVFRPLAWLMGVAPEHVAQAGEWLGVKVVVNEFVAYLALAQDGAALDARSRLIITYAMCGFANLGSVGIMLGGMSAMVPTRRPEIARLALPALAAGTIACCITGAAVGVLTAP